MSRYEILVAAEGYVAAHVMIQHAIKRIVLDVPVHQTEEDRTPRQTRPTDRPVIWWYLPVLPVSVLITVWQLRYSNPDLCQ